MPKQRYERQLIQFSSYSIAVVLPKKILTEFGWEAGETVRLRINPDTRELTLSKSEPKSFTQTTHSHGSRSLDEPAASPEDPSPVDSQDVTPIPEIL